MHQNWLGESQYRRVFTTFLIPHIRWLPIWIICFDSISIWGLIPSRQPSLVSLPSSEKRILSFWFLSAASSLLKFSRALRKTNFLKVSFFLCFLRYKLSSRFDVFQCDATSFLSHFLSHCFILNYLVTDKYFTLFVKYAWSLLPSSNRYETRPLSYYYWYLSFLK